MVSVMVHGKFGLRYQPRPDGGFDLKVATAVGEALHPTAIFVGRAPETPGDKEQELAMFGILKTWYERLAAELEAKYGEDLKKSTEISLGGGTTGLVGDGGAQA